MKKDCDVVKDIIDTWEREGGLDSSDLKILDEHIQTCRHCRERYRFLLPFILQDGTDNDAVSVTVPVGSLLRDDDVGPESSESSDDVIDRVMAGIEGESPEQPGRGLFRYIATAAAIVLALGITMKYVVFPTGPTVPAGKAETAQNVEYVQIQFKLTAPEAGSVPLVGDFTEWEVSKVQLEDPDDDGVWEAEVRLKKGNVYLYNFVIDGEEWIVDPESMMQIEDGFGGESSMLTL
jgi:hypothetical protein